MPLATRPKPWTPADVRLMRSLARKGMSARQAAGMLRRTVGAVKFSAMVRGVRFHAIEQPKGPQLRLARLRRKVGMSAVLPENRA
jgi:hypothetical protein